MRFPRLRDARRASRRLPNSQPRRAKRLRPGSLLLHIAVLLLCVAAVGYVVGWLLWTGLGRPDLAAPLPDPLVSPSPSSSGTPSPGPPSAGRSASRSLTASERLDSLKTLLTVIGGLGAVVVLTVAYRKQRHGENAELREDTKLFTDRFGAAADQLGSDRAAVRLAGVYAMARLADDAEDAGSRQMCIDVLCAYLRMPYTPSEDDGRDSTPRRRPRPLRPGRRPDPAPTPATEIRNPREEREVRETAIRLITVHLRDDAAVSWRGHDFDFTGAAFDRGDFSNVEFSGGRISFSRAKFSGGRVSFGGAEFSGGEVSFDGAEFSGGEVSFDDAEFSGGEVSFTRAEFSGGEVSFTRAEFSGGRVSFTIAKFSGGEVSFSRAKFSGAEVDLAGVADFTTPAVFDASDRIPPGLLLPTSNPALGIAERAGPSSGDGATPTPT